jgi:hypothetical protein
MADSLMSPDSGVERRTYPKSAASPGTKQTSVHTETDRISGGPSRGEDTGPTGSDRSYPKGSAIDMSADFLPQATDIYVGGVGPEEGG